MCLKRPPISALSPGHVQSRPCMCVLPRTRFILFLLVHSWSCMFQCSEVTVCPPRINPSKEVGFATRLTSGGKGWCCLFIVGISIKLYPNPFHILSLCHYVSDIFVDFPSCPQSHVATWWGADELCLLGAWRGHRELLDPICKALAYLRAWRISDFWLMVLYCSIISFHVVLLYYNILYILVQLLVLVLSQPNDLFLLAFPSIVNDFVFGTVLSS